MNRIGNYRVVETLEKTNHAELYKVKMDSKTFVLKIAKEPNPELKALIAREFHILSQFNHKNIVKVFDYGITDNNRAYFTSEFISGVPMNKFFKNCSKKFIDALLQLLDALIQFHNSNYIHSDLKPEHILYIPKKERVVLIDFGFASLLNEWRTPRGTVGYIAPEVLKGSGVDQCSDLYSLGVIMYEILSKKPVSQPKYKGKHMTSLFSRDQIDSGVPEGIKNVVFKLLATEPALRPTVGDVYEALVKFSSKKQLKKLNIRVSLPQFPFMDVCRITNHLSEIENIEGKTFVISGDDGIGKTRILSELRFKYLLSGNNIISFSTRKGKRFFDEISEFSGFKLSVKKTESKLTMFEQLVEALNAKRKTTDRHLIIMVDDLDELGKLDQSFYRYLGFSIKDSKIVLIATARPTAEIDKMGFENLQLGPFTNIEVRQFINRTFNNMVDGEFSDWLYEASGGNPLFMEEILKLLSQKNLLYFKENRWHITNEVLNRFYYPGKIEDIILPKIENLDSASKKVLQILALYKNPMEPIILTHVAGIQSLGRIEYLDYIGLVRKAQLNGRLAYVVASDMIKKVVEKDISEKESLQLYRDFFTFIKKNFSGVEEYIPYIAKYAEVCNDVQNAYTYSLKAADIKQNKYDFQECVKFLRKAVQYAENVAPENLVPLFMKIGMFENRLGNTDSALSTYLNALKYAKKRSENAEINYKLGQVYQVKGQYDKSIEYFNKSLSTVEIKNVKYANILSSLSYSLIYSKRFPDAQSFLKESLGIAEEIQKSELKAKTLYLLAVLEWFRKNYKEGIKIAKNALKIAQINNDLDLVSKCYNLLGSLYQLDGDFKKAEEKYDFVIQLFQSQKNINALVSAIINSALISTSQVKLEKAIQLLHSAHDYEKKIGNNKEMARIFFNLANVYEIKGNFDKAIELNNQAMDINPDAVIPIYSLSMLWFKKGKIETAQKFLEDVLNLSDDPLYYFGQALLDAHSGKIVEGESRIKDGFKKMLESKMHIFKKTECYLRAIEFHYNIKRYEDCYSYASEALKFLPSDTREYIIADAIFKLSGFLINKIETLEISYNLNKLKTSNCLYDWTYLKRMELETLYSRRKQSIISKIDEIFNIEEIFRNFGAYLEFDRIQILKNQVLRDTKQLEIRKSISLEYLNVFHEISEIIHNHLGEDDYVEKILDILISTTQADRGILFFIEKSKIKLMAGRNLDQETIEDARKVSKSVIRESGRKGEIVCCSDALADRRFKNARSVILNQIRSFMCTPLKIGMRTIGAIYLDSKHACDLFSNEDKDFLLTVANLVASTIERSKAFQKIIDENVFLRMGILSVAVDEYLIGESPVIKEIRNMIEKIAKTDSTVLITGETGSGKGMVARLIHQRSTRKNNRFIPVNCGSLPETLFESELFGYKKGAFTSACSDKKGLFEEADGGTLFLDDITNASVTAQGKLLEAIEEKKIRRLGETIRRKVDVRLISSTNQNLEEMLVKGFLRNDLFYRINVFTIHIAPLRERSVDIPILADHFLKKYTTELNRQILGFDKETLKMMLTYSWPGNVRELQNAIERAVILAQDPYISTKDLKLGKVTTAVPKRDKLNNKERIINALEATKGNVSLASKLLGVGRSTFYRYIKKYSINISKNYQ